MSRVGDVVVERLRARGRTVGSVLDVAGLDEDPRVRVEFRSVRYRDTSLVVAYAGGGGDGSVGVEVTYGPDPVGAELVHRFPRAHSRTPPPYRTRVPNADYARLVEAVTPVGEAERRAAAGAARALARTVTETLAARVVLDLAAALELRELDVDETVERALPVVADLAAGAPFEWALRRGGLLP